MYRIAFHSTADRHEQARVTCKSVNKYNHVGNVVLLRICIKNVNARLKFANIPWAMKRLETEGGALEGIEILARQPQNGRLDLCRAARCRSEETTLFLWSGTEQPGGAGRTRGPCKGAPAALRTGSDAASERRPGLSGGRCCCCFAPDASSCSSREHPKTSLDLIGRTQFSSSKALLDWLKIFQHARPRDKWIYRAHATFAMCASHVFKSRCR